MNSDPGVRCGSLLTAIDGDVKGGGRIDKFRTEIRGMPSKTIVYDNKMNSVHGEDLTTALGGGHRHSRPVAAVMHE